MISVKVAVGNKKYDCLFSLSLKRKLSNTGTWRKAQSSLVVCYQEEEAMLTKMNGAMGETKVKT